MIGKNVRMIRKNTKITQVALAKHIGCSVSQLRNIEAGRSYPSIQILEKIADATDSDLVIGFICKK